MAPESEKKGRSAMGGEAKARRKWIEQGGEDWGRVGFVNRTSRWSLRTRGMSAEAIKKLELERDRRRLEQKGKLFGLMGFMQKGVGLSKEQIKRITAVRAQMKKRGASAAARRAFR